MKPGSEVSGQKSGVGDRRSAEITDRKVSAIALSVRNEFLGHGNHLAECPPDAMDACVKVGILLFRQVITRLGGSDPVSRLL